MGHLALTELGPAFAGRRVLVTGHTGFKGSWLSLWLTELGASVVGFALPPKTPQDHFVEAGIASLVSHVEGDIRDAASLERVVSEAQPEFVFHLAAQAIVSESYVDPKTTFETNVGGTVNVLDVVRRCNSVRALVCVTSDKCYRNQEWVWGYRENDALGGRDPYSASKAAAELAFAAYHSSFFAGRTGFAAATARAGNVIGGGDWSPDRIVPDCIRAFSARHAVVLRRPMATRPWQHVLEPLSGYLWLARQLAHGQVESGGSWNFGPSSDSLATVRELVDRAAAVWGDGADVQVGGQPFHEAGLLRLNIDKAQAELGWTPRWDLDRTIRETVGWYRSRERGADVASLSRRQIAAYVGSTE